eukprot:202863-Pleurochrysis_carterae.AAC.1
MECAIQGRGTYTSMPQKACLHIRAHKILDSSTCAVKVVRHLLLGGGCRQAAHEDGRHRRSSFRGRRCGLTI